MAEQYTAEQIEEAKKTSVLGAETLRLLRKKYILENLNPDKEWNIIVTPEGLGKSILVPDYIKIMGASRIVLLCKSYEQLNDKKKLYNTKFPELGVECIPSNERFLNSYQILKHEWIWETDEVTGEKYVNITDTIIASEIHPSVKKQALQEKEYFDAIISGTIHKDIILLTEDKLKAEVVHKENFRGEGELFCWDEFNPDNWFEWNVLPEFKAKMLKDIKSRKIIDFPTWSDRYNVRLMYDQRFTDLMRGRKIVLSTEKKAMLYFTEKAEETVEVIYAETYFECPKVNIHRVNPAVMRKQDNRKKLLSASLRQNGYSVWGNGVESKINNTTMLGQNYHDRISADEKIVLVLSQPCPEQIAPLMKNLGIDDYQATVLYMSDILNQYLGRCHGFRNIKYGSFDVIIPNNFATAVLKHCRYICNVHVGTKNPEIFGPNGKIEKAPTLMTKIIHTLASDAGCHYSDHKMYLHTLKHNTYEFLNKVSNVTGRYLSELKAKYKNLWCYKFPVKEMISNKVLRLQASLLKEARYTTKSLTDLYGLLKNQYMQDNGIWDLALYPS